MAEDEPPRLPAVPVEYESPGHQLTFNVDPREVDYYLISAGELDELAGGNSSTALAITCTGAGIVATLLVTVLTIPLDDKALAVAVGALLGCLLATVGFGVATLRQSRTSRRLLDQIKAQRRRPVPRTGP